MMQRKIFVFRVYLQVGSQTAIYEVISAFLARWKVSYV